MINRDKEKRKKKEKEKEKQEEEKKKRWIGKKEKKVSASHQRKGERLAL